MSVLEKQPHSAAFLKQRKMLLVLPLLVTPFLTMAFWALGGGKGDGKQVLAEKEKGFNFALPSAENKSETPDKMASYEQARKDSIARERDMKLDPYYKQDFISQQAAAQQAAGMNTGPNPPGGFGSPSNYGTGSPYNNSSYSGYGYNDPNERRVNEKLAELQASLNAKTTPQPSPYAQNPPNGNSSGGMSTSDIDRLEKMMNMMQSGGGNASEPDPEMQQIQDVLGQILDIQHPERVNERLQKNSASNFGMVYPVTSVRSVDPITLLESKEGKSDSGKKKVNGFFSLNEEKTETEQNAIAAEMYTTQSLVSGSIVKLRLLNDIYVNGQLIPKDSFIFGTAQITGERLGIEINSLRFRNSLFPVKLAVYDIDGMSGIHIPGAISRDVAKQSGDRAIQSIGMTSLDPSMSAQALSAGIEAAKSLMSKKVKLVKVTVKAGYQVLLKDQNQKDGPIQQSKK